MGLAASQARYLNLHSSRADLEFQGQQVNQKRTVLANSTQELFTEYMKLSVPVEPVAESTTSAEYQAELAKYKSDKAAYDAKITEINLKEEAYQAQDRSLEMELKNIDTQHSAVQTEIDAVKKIIEKNIEATFKTFQ